MFAAVSCWFEPIENGVQAAQRAREGLIAGGDLAYAGYTYQLAVPYLLDCAPSLESFVAEVEAGLAFLRRTGDEQTGQWLDSYQWLAGVLRGESSAAASEAIPVDRYADNPLRAALRASQPRASPPPSSAIRPAWRSTARRRCRCSRPPPGSYATAVAHLLRGLALAEQARATDGDERGESAVRAGRGDALAGRPRRGRAGQLPAPAAAASRPSGRGRSATSAPPLLAFDAARREVAAAAAAMAPGPDRRTRGPLLSRPRRSNTPATTCSPRPARSTSPGARPRRSTSWTGPTRPCDRRPTRPPGRGDEPVSSHAARPSRPGRSTCSGSCPRPRRSARRPASNGCTRAWSRCSAR